MNQHYRELLSYMIIIFISVSLSFLLQRAVDLAQFKAPGSRFTGEDAIWLIENSNIILNRDARIDGITTPFREYINRDK